MGSSAAYLFCKLLYLSCLNSPRGFFAREPTIVQKGIYQGQEKNIDNVYRAHVMWRAVVNSERYCIRIQKTHTFWIEPRAGTRSRPDS